MSFSPAACPPSCTASLSYTFSSAGSYSVYAQCRDAAGNTAQGTSRTVTVPSLSVTLSASSTNVPPGTNVELTATASRSLTGTPYIILIYYSESGFWQSCSQETNPCTITVGSPTPTTTTYTARIARNTGTDVQATSDPVSVTWSSYFPACNKATPETGSNFWRVADDCWSSGSICGMGAESCVYNYACFIPIIDRSYRATPATADSITIPKGTWDITATMNSRSYAECNGAE